MISNYEYPLDWVLEYSDNYEVWSRADNSKYTDMLNQEKVKRVENRGSDILDKFDWIIKNYEQLPACTILTKGNLFKYITKEEFDKIKDNKTFTPILTQNHQEKEGVCYYKDGLYYEINNFWYLGSHPCKSIRTQRELCEMLGMNDKEYIGFAPGSNYIIPRENILKHPKSFYEKLRSYLDWTVYPGEAQIIERNLYNIWSLT